MKSATNGGATTNYTYDGDGRRASKSSGKLYWYSSGGDILAETDASGNTSAEYIFFGGERIAMLPAGGNPIYYVEDMLGTSRVITTSTGIVCYDADFYPYGGERPYTNTCAQNYKFTGKERDSETGLDNFGARYDSSSLGRFMSPDIGPFHLGNPQSLNRYTYALNNPLFYVDPDGEDSIQWPFRLGTASVNTFVASGEGFDAGGLLASLSGGPEHLPLRDLQNSQPMATARELETGLSHSDTSGGCIFGCTSSFDTVPSGVSINLSFNYDSDTNKVTGANIGYSIDASATFIGPDPRPQKYAHLPLPGMTPNPEITYVRIDPNVLRNLSSEQLNALLSAATKQANSIRAAIRDSVIREQQRRAEEQRKKEEERKRKWTGGADVSAGS